jgi:subtilisin-like proprotein convertase family protein
VEATLFTDACVNSVNEVNYIEQIEVIVSVRTDVRGKLEIYITSPMGTRSQLLPVNEIKII